MATYTSEEIQAVVEKLVMSTIRRPYDTLGVRRTDISFNDVQEAAAGVFILYPNAPFYVLYLGTQRLNDVIAAEVVVLDQLLAAIDACGRNVLPVEDVTSLFNAQAALQELGGASRQGAFADITKAPAYQRFSANVDAFLAGPGLTVKSAGNIVQTPQQARSVIPGLLDQLREQHERLLTKVRGIAGGMEDYNKVNLPSVVSTSVLTNSARLVGADADALNVLTPTERLALIRQTVLDVLAVRSVVTTFGSFAGPSDYYTLDGIGLPFSDTTREATPAKLVAEFAGAAGIIAGVSDELIFGVDGEAPFSILLNPSQMAQVEGYRDDSVFVIGNGATPTDPGYTTPNNNVVKVSVGGTVYTATLTVSPDINTPRTAEQVAAEIQAAMPAGVTVEGYYSPLRFTGLMDVPAGVDQTWTLTLLGSSDLVALGITTSDTARMMDGPDAGTIYPITAVTPDTIAVTGTTTGSTGTTIEIGRANRKVRIRLSDPATQLPIEQTLATVGDTPASLNALETLGFYPGVVFSCKRTTADLVAADINTKTAAITAGTELIFTKENFGARTDILDPNKLILSNARAVGSQTFTGPVLTYIVSSVTKAGSVAVGDVLVLRDGPNPDEFYTVATINGSAAAGAHALAIGDVLVANGSVTGTPISGVACELGPSITGNKYDVFQVLSGPNADTFFVQSQGDTPLDFFLQTPIPFFRDGAAAIDMRVSFGGMYLSSTSKNKTTESEISISGSASNFYFSTSTTGKGTTPWFQLPALPRGLQAGDVLETYPTDYKTPSASYRITSVGTPRVIGLQPDIPCGVSWQFTVQPPPFARLRVGTMNDYVSVKEQLDSWLLLPENQESFFTNVNRLINPLLVNENPTAVQVGTALASVRSFYGVLLADQSEQPEEALDTIIDAFTVQPVDAVDTLLQSFREKGSNRATDLLLSGAFASFFGLTVDGSSYAGAFQEAVRDVAMSDLPVRRFERPDVQSSALVGQAQSPDFEYSPDNITEKVVPDVRIMPRRRRLDVQTEEEVVLNEVTTLGGGGGALTEGDSLLVTDEDDPFIDDDGIELME